MSSRPEDRRLIIGGRLLACVATLARAAGATPLLLGIVGLDPASARGR